MHRLTDMAPLVDVHSKLIFSFSSLILDHCYFMVGPQWIVWLTYFMVDFQLGYNENLIANQLLKIWKVDCQSTICKSVNSYIPFVFWTIGRKYPRLGIGLTYKKVDCDNQLFFSLTDNPNRYSPTHTLWWWSLSKWTILVTSIFIPSNFFSSIHSFTINVKMQYVGWVWPHP